MVAVVERLEHMVLPNISWDTFERILDEIGETHYRVTYQRGRLEFMTISLKHDHFGEWIGRLIFFIAFELRLPLFSGGSTTLKLALEEVGLEPDRCFWIKHEADMRGKEAWNAVDNPPPDLAVEIDITTSWLDRLDIYSKLKVPEVWRFDGETFRVLLLDARGNYRERAKSLTFPFLPMDGFARFVKKLDSADEVSLIQEFTEWLRTSVGAKKAADKQRNGRR